MTVFNGYLFSKLAAIGTKSEGPKYFLQQADYHELVVCKKVEHWQKDPVLHPHLDFKVVIEGELLPDGIHYVSKLPQSKVTLPQNPSPQEWGGHRLRQEKASCLWHAVVQVRLARST